jgi:hypothetical protein
MNHQELSRPLLSRLKGALLGAAAAATFALTPMAHADLLPTGYAVGSQQFSLSFGGTQHAGGFTGTWDGTPIVFWCVELDQFFSFGGDYVYLPSLPNDATFTLLGKLFTEAYGLALTDAAHSAAFQLAIWEIIYERNDLHIGSGTFRVTDDLGNAAAVAWAQQWLDGLATTPDNYNVFSLQSGDHQNFITSLRVVPEPAPIALLVLASLGALVIVRRKARTQRAAAL